MPSGIQKLKPVKNKNMDISYIVMLAAYLYVQHGDDRSYGEGGKQ